jgi:hypothetical protein
MKLEKSLIYLRLTLLWVLLVLCPSLINAQQRFSAGLVGGFNASQIDGDELAGFDRVGIHTGILTTIDLESSLNVHMEFLYSQRGSRPDVFQPEYDPDIEIGLDYIELPVYMSIGDWWQEEGEYFKASFHGGLSYGRLISSDVTDNYNSAEFSLEEYAQYFNENDLSWLLGFSFRWSQHWGVTARYTRGITPLLDPAKHNLNTSRLMSYWMTIRFDYYFK